MAGDDSRAAGGDAGRDAPGGPSDETIARLRDRARQLRAAAQGLPSEQPPPEEPPPEEPPPEDISEEPPPDPPPPEAAQPDEPDEPDETDEPDDRSEPDDPDGGLGAPDAATSELLDRWTEDAPGESVEPRRNWSNVVAVLVVVAVVALAFAGGWALISGSDEDGGPAGPGGADEDDEASVLAEDGPSLDELTSDVTLPPGPPEGIQVAAQGVSVVPDRFDPDRREGTFAVVLTNPHERWLAQGVQVAVTFVDEAGTTLGSDDGFVEVVLPGQQAAVGSLFFDAPTVPVARMDVAVEVARWRETGPVDGGFTVTDVQTGEAEFSGVRTTFTITSDFDEPLTDVGVTAVYRAADGRVIGGYDTFVERLDPGVPTPAQVGLLANIDPAAIATTELYPTAAFGSVPDGAGD